MKKGFLLFLLAGIIFVIGCQNGDTEGGRFVGGDDGLDISFVEDAPPDRTGDDNSETFDVGILLENKGEYDIKEGGIIATLQGLDKNAFSLNSLSKKSDFELNGKEKVRDKTFEGDTDELIFGNAKYKFDLDSDFEFDFSADVCYEYGTKAVTDICLKKEPSKRRRVRDRCEVDNDKLNIENSGAPVKVAFARQRASSGSVKIDFDIEKKGTGDIYAPKTFTNDCIEDLNNKDKLGVKVESASGKLPIKCSKFNDSNEGFINLIDGKRTLTCEIGTGSLQEIAFEEPLTITLNYFYRDSESKKLIVENSEF